MSVNRHSLYKSEIAVTVLLMVLKASLTAAEANSKQGHEPNYWCNYATVTVVKSNKAAVFSSRHAKASVIAYLPLDSPVYICNEAHGWYEVRFGETCSERFLNGMRYAETDRCKVGWMLRKNVVVQSG